MHQASLQVVKAPNLTFYSADMSIPTDTTFSFSSMCVVLVRSLPAMDCQPGAADTTMGFYSLQSQRLYLTLNTASEMHFHAFQCKHRLA